MHKNNAHRKTRKKLKLNTNTHLNTHTTKEKEKQQCHVTHTFLPCNLPSLLLLPCHGSLHNCFFLSQSCQQNALKIPLCIPYVLLAFSLKKLCSLQRKKILIWTHFHFLFFSFSSVKNNLFNHYTFNI